MAMTCPTGFDVAHLRDSVRVTYDRVAREPHGSFHFHRGAAYAAQLLGYDADDLAAVPASSADRFAGVGNPHAAGSIHAGETVLDHACGAGMDLIIAARKVGPTGRAIGVDMTPAMVQAARRGLLTSGAWRWADVHEGFYESLPVDDASVDVLLSNGVLNLAPDKRRVFGEICRVLRPGGRLHLSDVVVQRELTLEARANPELWAACVAGALPEAELLETLRGYGFEEVRVVERHDCFRATTAEAKVSADLQVMGITVFARRPM